MPVPAPDPSKLPAGKPAYKLIELEQTIENAQVFHDAIDELKRNNRFSQAVYVHNVDEYVNYDMYLTEDSKAGFAIEDGDNLVSVFSYAGKLAGHSLVQSAVDRGARRLDCYDIEHHLPVFARVLHPLEVEVNRVGYRLGLFWFFTYCFSVSGFVSPVVPQ